MKSLKKILSIFAAFMMVVGLTAANVKAVEGETEPVDTTEYKITINNTVKDKTYAAYKVFNATYSEDGNNVAYTANSVQKNAFDTLQNVPFVFTPTNDTDTWMVSLAAGTTEKTLAQFFQDNRETLISKFGTPVASQKSVADKATVELNVSGGNGGAGYYFVDAGQGSVVMLDRVTPTKTINDKNSSNGDKNLTNTTDQYVQIGDEVSYTVHFTVYPGTTSYEYVDTMTGLDYVKIDSLTKGTTALATPTNYTVTTDPSNSSTFTLALTDTELASIKNPAGETYTLVYTTKVNAKAFNGTITNEASFRPNGTETSTTTVTSHNLTLTIQKTKEDEKTLLDGAEFVMYKGVKDGDKWTAGTTTMKFVEVEDGYRVATTEDTNTVETIKVTNGTINVYGLDQDFHYFLKETKAPAGYVLPNENVEVEPELKDGSTSEYKLEMTQGIANTQGSSLPETGGMGTTMIYIAGAILMVGAAIIFVTNKRMKHE